MNIGVLKRYSARVDGIQRYNHMSHFGKMFDVLNAHCHNLPLIATICHSLPQSATHYLATDCHTLPQSATHYLATDCHTICHTLPCYRLPHNLPRIATYCHIATFCHTLPHLIIRYRFHFGFFDRNYSLLRFVIKMFDYSFVCVLYNVFFIFSISLPSAFRSPFNCTRCFNSAHCCTSNSHTIRRVRTLHFSFCRNF